MKLRFWIALSSLLSASEASTQTAGNWIRQNPLISPAGEIGHALAYDSAHNQAVLFGGSDGTSDSNGISVWNVSEWTPLYPGVNPSPRNGLTMAFDAARNQMVMFGGRQTTNGVTTILADTWVWDGFKWAKKSPQTSPPARFAHAMSYDAKLSQIVIFGGQGSAGGSYLRDTWVWDGSNWTQKSPQNSPSARSYHTMAYDSARGQTVLFGGWNFVSSTSLDIRNDTWIWDGTNWVQSFPQTSPPARYGHAMTYDSAHSQTVIFGGNTYISNSNSVNDTWIWDGTNWTNQSLQTTPPALNGHAMAFDAAHGSIVLFGGAMSNGQYSSDTWLWDRGVSTASVQPAISRVISASGFGGFSGVAPGGWIEIYGSNLASSTRLWGGADFIGSNAPVRLDGVQVFIARQLAFVEYISPGQLNVQAPSTIISGSAQVTVSNSNGTSAPFDVTVNPVEPGFLAPAAFKIGGNQYVVAQLPDGNFVLPSGAIPGVNSRPARPGETIVIYGTGFGSVTPDIPAGQVAAQSNQTIAPVRILFGGTPGQVTYSGLAPNQVGLFQFNVIVPVVPDSNMTAMTITVGGGVPGAQTIYTAVHQ